MGNPLRADVPSPSTFDPVHPGSLHFQLVVSVCQVTIDVPKTDVMQQVRFWGHLGGWLAECLAHYGSCGERKLLVDLLHLRIGWVSFLCMRCTLCCDVLQTACTPEEGAWPVRPLPLTSASTAGKRTFRNVCGEGPFPYYVQAV